MKIHPFRKIEAFTLIELLVVIAIIALLAGILFPALSGAREAAKKTDAVTTLTAIQSAVLAYRNEYGTLPVLTSQSTPSGVNDDKILTAADHDELIKILSGNAVPQNTKRIDFLKSERHIKTVGSNRVFVDAWNDQFMLALDMDYDGVVQIAPSGVTTLDPIKTMGFLGWSWANSTNANSNAAYTTNGAKEWAKSFQM